MRIEDTTHLLYNSCRTLCQVLGEGYRLLQPNRSVMRGASALVLAVLAACDDGSASDRIAGSDADRSEAGAGANPADANADANSDNANPADANQPDASADASPHDVTTDADQGDAHSLDASGDAPADGGVCAHCPEFCGLFGCPDLSLCEAAVALEPDVKLTMQNTASGGHGECAGSASGVGGPSLYYPFSIPAGRYANVIATPVGPPPVGDVQRALIRVFFACDATKSTISNIGGDLVFGEAAICLKNAGSATRRVILAVSRYSGEYGDKPLAFDLSVVFHDSLDDCVISRFTL